MVEKQIKILISTFILLIIGIVLIQALADNVELVKVSSVNVSNETLSFTSVTTTISNESIIMTNETAHNLTGTLVNDNLTARPTEIRNITAQVVPLSFCNFTLVSGLVECNHTGYPSVLYFDYTYVSGRTETLANDEIITLAAVRNDTGASVDMTGSCNISKSDGILTCNNTHYNIGYCDYTYTPDNFVRGSASRQLITLTILFFALAVFTLGIIFVRRSFKDDGSI